MSLQAVGIANYLVLANIPPQHVLALAFDIGRPSENREIRKMIRQTNAANPLWGAARIHGESLARYIEISSR